MKTIWYIFRCVSVVVNIILGKLLTTVSIDGITKGIMIESMFVWKTVCKIVCLNISKVCDTMVP